MTSPALRAVHAPFPAPRRAPTAPAWALLLCLLLPLAWPAWAQAPDAAQEVPATPADAAIAALSAASGELQTLRDRLPQAQETAEFVQLRDAAVALEVRVQEAVRTLETESKAAQARAEELGPAPADASAEDADVRRRRQELADRVSSLDSAVARGRLLALDVRDLRDAAASAQNRRLGATLSERFGSPLGPRLWRSVAEDLPADRQRVQAFLNTLERTVGDAIARFGAAAAIGTALLALALAWPVRRLLRRLGRNYAIRHTPGGRLRRSALALWVVASGTACIGVAAYLLSQFLRWGQPASEVMERLADAGVAAAVLGALAATLGNGLLLPNNASWRLPPLPDDIVGRLRRYPWLAGGLIFLDRLVEAIAEAIRPNDALGAVVTGAVALSYGLLAIGVRRERLHTGGRDGGAVHLAAALRVLLAAMRLAVLLLLAALCLGYFQFALLVGREVVWVTIVAALLYLLWVGVDDLCGMLFGCDSRMAAATASAAGIPRRRMQQAGLIVAAVTKVALVLMAAGLVLAPLGTSFSGWRELLSMAAGGLRIGEVTIAPAGVAKALVILGGGWAAVQAAHAWLVERYLPATDLDSASRNSVATVARYFGVTLVAAMGLAALGISIQQIGLVVGALSVGIGFGLQAITQNFISGLILLAERPVKIGDWVSVGEFEGDVKKINVRATEILVADRSTVIVPNSDFITKPVRNVTLADPLGRVLVQFSVPLDTDVDAVRATLLEVFAQNPAVLDEPAPSVTLDGIANASIAITAVGFTRSPRIVGGTRSEVLFELLRRLRAQGITLAPTAQNIRLVQDPDAAAARDAGPGAPA
ncbi:DUF3772 domain-containing protein [Luteimonas huabeiensis]|uniref:DUF3772 domain-containing protein n=1 Tax=Luteimonas huabeiensis TaxID=1244513 RepID=UPI0012686B61|nr:DUF3772 domain-containing protein [Luteimonas huabeiensis]